MKFQALLLHIGNGRHKSLRHPWAILPGWIAGIVLLALAAGWIRGTNRPALAAEPVDATAVVEAMERLPVVGSVLLTGAHPDDENNALLAYLARGLHLRVAYLSATRGDGGQNLLGKERYEALGLLRTEELLAARRLDGAEQFFAQAYDFGFSKSAEETLVKWGREAVLGDYVRVIRRFRPDIVISRFTGMPSDGHGHHQSSGILTREAFRAAADPTRFPEQLAQGLTPWQATKLLLNQGGGGGGGRAAAPDSFAITLGGFSPLYGEAFGDLGMRARSQHRSQGMGGAAGRGGPYTATFRAVDSVPSAPQGSAAKDLFEGVDLTLGRFTTLAGGAPSVAQKVAGIQKAIEEARATLSPLHPDRVLPALAQGLSLLRDLRGEIEPMSLPPQSKEQALFLLAQKESDFAHAIAMAGGIRLDALSETAEVVPGGTFQVSVTGLLRATDALQAGDVSLTGPPGWKIEPVNPAGAPGNQRDRAEAKFRVTVPTDAPFSQPYWLVPERVKDYFPVASALAGAAHSPALLKASFQFVVSANGKPMQLEERADVVYRYTDRIYGERERPLTVVLPVAVWVEPEVAVFPAGARASRTFLVKLRNMAATEQRGTLRLDLPAGAQASSAATPFLLPKRGDEIAVRFAVTAPASRPGSFEKDTARAVAEVAGRSYATGFEIIDYPHIQTQYLFRPATADLLRFDVKVAPGLKVGYVMGSGDDVPEALQQLGVAVTLLSPEDLAFGDLKQFDAIVTGIRAYEVRKDLSANQARLLEYVSGGGLMIVQYSRTGGFSDPLGPYPMNLGSQPRVAVEEAPVEILEPAHPLFHFPNEITAKDFNGWVQERGTYFMESWAPEYKPLLSSNDPGEPPQKGGMLLASHGKGLYLYTGYVWFRQLPAGVPGAYRIFANMISLAKAARR